MIVRMIAMQIIMKMQKFEILKEQDKSIVNNWKYFFQHQKITRHWKIPPKSLEYHNSRITQNLM